MSSPSSSSDKKDLKIENSAEIKQEEKPIIITPKQEFPQEVVSERTIPPCPNLGVATPKIEKDAMQSDPPKDNDDKVFVCMKCQKEFPATHIRGGGDQTTQIKKDPEVESRQNLIKQVFLVYSTNASSSSSSSRNNASSSSFNGGSSSSSNTDFPLFSDGVTKMKPSMFSPPSRHPSLFPNYNLPYANHRRVPLGYGGRGSSSTNSKPLFGNGVTRGVSSMFSPPTPNRFFTGSTGHRTYKPKPRSDYSSYGGSKNNKNSVASWVNGEVPRDLIDLNKPPCSLVDLYLKPTGITIDSNTRNIRASPQTTSTVSSQENGSSSEISRGKGKAKMEFEDDDKKKGLGMISWGTKRKRTH